MVAVAPHWAAVVIAWARGAIAAALRSCYPDLANRRDGRARGTPKIEEFPDVEQLLEDHQATQDRIPMPRRSMNLRCR